MDSNGFTDLHSVAPEPRRIAFFFVWVLLSIGVTGGAAAYFAWRFAVGPMIAEWQSKECKCAVDDFTLEHYPNAEPK